MTQSQSLNLAKLFVEENDLVIGTGVKISKSYPEEKSIGII